jgi:hypothetical protein
MEKAQEPLKRVTPPDAPPGPDQPGARPSKIEAGKPELSPEKVNVRR